MKTRAWRAGLCVLLALQLTAARADKVAVFSGPVSVPLEGQSVTLDLTVEAEPVAPDGLRLWAQTPLAPVLAQGQVALAGALNDLPRSGENRFVPGGLVLGSAPGMITVRADLRYERWQDIFGWKKILRESGTIHAGFAPSVQAGRLQLGLSRFRIDGLSDVSRFFDLESRMRGKLESEIRKLNANDKAMGLPAPVVAQGFAYESVTIDSNLRLSITGPDSAMALLRVMGALQSGGL